MLFLGIFPSRYKQEFWLCGEISHWTSLTPDPPLPYSPPCRLYPPLSRGVRSSVSTLHLQKPSCKATGMNQLCLSAALLFVIMGTPVARTPGGETSIQAQDKSQITSPLQVELGWMGEMKGSVVRWGEKDATSKLRVVSFGGNF